MKNMSIKELTVCGVSVCLAFVLSFIRIFELPMGGSVTLCSMLFICIIGYMFGLKAGLLSAFVYGILQFVQDPQMYTPLQVIIDYVFAFTALGLSGVFHNKKFGLQAGLLLGITGRFLFATLSGVVFFGEYTPEGWNPIWYSVCYNGSYIYAEGIISLIILSIPAVKKGIDKIIESSLQNVA